MKSAKDLIDEMAADLAMLPNRLEAIVQTAPLRYKKFTIPKRNGKPREVAQPAREVKAIQRWLNLKLAAILPVHEAATGYRLGWSIGKNAAAHVSSNYLLKMDFEEFFPSIKFDDIVAHLRSKSGQTFDESGHELIARSTTWTPTRRPPLRLCVGAPTSPFLSNSVMFDFDTLIAEIARADGVTYTRYADDLTFSCKEKDVLQDYPRHVRRIARELVYPTLRINKDKTIHASRGGRRVVTGIVLDSTGLLSVGRERKRTIRAMFHRLMQGLLSAEDAERLSGLVAFVESIEPGFTERLSR